jgi:hypothetical protein
MKKPTLQELAEFLRDAAYSDNMSHEIDWSLRVLHPRDNDGSVGFSGGLWTRRNTQKAKSRLKDVSISFSYSETQGITQFQLWRDHMEIRGFPFGEHPSFEAFRGRVIAEFGIEELYDAKEGGGCDVHS